MFWKRPILKIEIRNDNPEYQRGLLTATSDGPEAWTAGDGEKQVNLVGSGEAELLEKVVAEFPNHFRVFRGDQFQIRSRLKDGNLLFLYLTLDGDEGLPLNSPNRDWEAIAEDFGLACDREVILDHEPLACTRDGIVIPLDVLLGQKDSLFSVGWSETESRTSGLDYYDFIQLSAQVAIVCNGSADDSRQFRLVRLGDRVDSIYEYIVDLDTDWSSWAYYDHPEALKECLTRMLGEGATRAEYWGLNSHFKDGGEDGHDCNAQGCWKTSQTSWWYMSHALEPHEARSLGYKLAKIT